MMCFRLYSKEVVEEEFNLGSWFGGYVFKYYFIVELYLEFRFGV